MPKWEYRVEYLCHRGHESEYVPGSYKLLWQKDLEQALNKLGSKGWELVFFPQDILLDQVEGFAVFKRPKED